MHRHPYQYSFLVLSLFVFVRRRAKQVCGSRLWALVRRTAVRTGKTRRTSVRSAECTASSSESATVQYSLALPSTTCTCMEQSFTYFTLYCRKGKKQQVTLWTRRSGRESTIGIRSIMDEARVQCLSLKMKRFHVTLSERSAFVPFIVGMRAGPPYIDSFIHLFIHSVVRSPSFSSFNPLIRKLILLTIEAASLSFLSSIHYL